MLLATGDWTAPNLIQSVLALGTLVMAGAALLSVRASNQVAADTGRLAGETEKLAAATNRTVDLARDELNLVERQLEVSERQVTTARLSLQSAIRPLLVNIPPGRVGPGIVRHANADAGAIVFFQPGGPHEAALDPRIVVPLRNIGPGPAFIQEALIEVPWTRRRSQPSGLVIAPGEPTTFTFQVTKGPEGVSSPWLRVEITYTDVAGEQTLRTTLYAEHDQRWAVRQLILSEQKPDGTYTDLITSQV